MGEVLQRRAGLGLLLSGQVTRRPLDEASSRRDLECPA
jgi:hypothetical protein